MTKGISYRPEVDGLRALAVVQVILFHAGFSWMSGGFVGVDVFFVISGYLIAAQIVSEMRRGTFELGTFYERRVRRILPALLFMTAMCVPFAWLWLSPSDLKDFSWSLVAVPAFASNFLFWIKGGYFATNGELRPLLHTWSLSVEEQFYLLFPLLLSIAAFAGRRIGPIDQRAIVLTILAVAIASLFTMLRWTEQLDTKFYLLPARAWELMLGALLAFLSRCTTAESLPRPLCEVLGLLGLLLITYAALVFDDSVPFPGIHSLIPTVGAALVIAFAWSGTLTARLLSSRALVSIGLVSYSAYLWHQPVLVFSRARYFQEGIGLSARLFLVVLVFVLAYLTWRWIERPFRNRTQVSRRTVWLLAPICSLLVASVGAASVLDSTLIQGRTSPQTQKIIASASFSPKRIECHTSGRDYRPPMLACSYFGKDDSWAVLGDSHAVELAYVLARKVQDRDEAVRHLTFSSCPPAYKLKLVGIPGCSDWTQEAVDYIKTMPSIRHVVISYRYSSHLFGPVSGPHARLPDRDPPIDGSESKEVKRALVIQSLLAMARELEHSGKTVFLVLPVPEMAQPIGQLTFYHYHVAGRSDDAVGVPLSFYLQRHKLIRDALLQDSSLTVKLIDPLKSMCDERNCYAIRQGRALYFDNHHLSLAGAELIVDDLLNLADQTSRSRRALVGSTN